MSSILKALKKLENESLSEGKWAAWPKKLGPRKTIHRWEINSGRFSLVLWGAMALILLSASIWFILYMARPTTPATVAVVPPASTVGRVQPSEKPSRRASPAAPAPKAQAKTAVRSPARSKPKTAPARNAMRLPPPVPQRSAPRPRTPAQKASGASSPVRQIPVLQSGLKLQAISWARQAEDRIAVIGGNIVREGSALEGYTIAKIEQDQVVVTKGAEEWRLVFNLK